MQAASPSCLREHRTGQQELPGRRMKEMNSDTIAAVSTAMSPAGIGIVRISGTHAFEIADRIYDSGTKKKKKLSEQPSHTIHYGFLVDGEEVIDEVLVTLLKGPRSYTAEDTVEINCHGGVFAVKRVLSTACAIASVLPVEDQ